MSKTETDNTKQIRRSGRTANVLVVDDDPQFARFMLEILARKGVHADLANDEKVAVGFLDKNSYDVVFASEAIVPGRQRGSFELLAKIRANSPELPVVMIAGPPLVKGAQNGNSVENEKWNTNPELISKAVKVIQAGCCDFLVKPLDHGKVENLLDTLLPDYSVSTQASAQEGTSRLYKIVGKSTKLNQTVHLAGRVAPTSVPVLISGESGTGKELISYFIHHKSKRAQGPYVKVNCAALSDSLLESELFGHEKGAFTGAYTQRKGRFEMAHGGTLLLDEITETPPKFQAKLLRIIEQQDFERVGGNENIRVNVRIISTTNKDLLQEVQHGRFRQDLYYRLSGVRVIIPALRQHLEDLPDLVWHFVNLYAAQAQRHITKLAPMMMDILARYHWPGNVRQLRNVVLTSLILGVGQTLSLADVSWLFDDLQPLPEIANRGLNAKHCGLSTGCSTANTGSGLGGVPLEEIEQRAILDTLRQTAGNQTKAAKVLGISDRTLRDRIRRYRQQGCLQPT